MSNTTLIIGESGAGKSSSLRNLNPAETFIINILDKPLPFKGYNKLYIPITGWEDKKGNYLSADNWQKIIKCIQVIDKERPDIKTLIIDDFGYIMSNEFMSRCHEKGYDKYNDLALHVYLIIKELINTRADLFCFVFAHCEVDNTGFSKIKTIGKLLEEKISLAGMFTTCLHALVIENKYKFLTQNNGTHLAKSPMDLFDELLIDNDLELIINKLKHYFN